VLATTSPAQILEPFAAMIGFDAVVASRYNAVHGVLDGTFENDYLWGAAKRDAVAEWATANQISLGDSWAYSDSYYDVPLLEAVGNPVAVNPDLRLRISARRNGWPVRRFDAPKGVSKLGPFELQNLAMPWLRPEFMAFTQLDLRGLDNLPADGPAILAANHRSYFDPLAICYAAAQVHRPVRFLAKAELFDVPAMAAVLETLGVIRVDRGSGSDAPLEAAATELDAGELVVILPEGTIPRGEEFFDPDLKGRPGIARLARATGAPVIPIGLWGTENVWPRSSRIPRFWDVTGRPEVVVNVGPALRLRDADEAVETKRVMDAISDLLPEAAHEQHTPSADEMARTYPGGLVPEAEET
jgi:putative phosphoserine phosphatase/1-acylglycerol-3-phosphate O-acyltransferase